MVSRLVSSCRVIGFLRAAILYGENSFILRSRSFCTEETAGNRLRGLLIDFGISPAQADDLIGRNYRGLDFDSFYINKSLTTLTSFGIPRKDIVSLISSCSGVLDFRFLQRWEVSFAKFRDLLIPSCAMKNILECSRRMLVDPDRFESCLRTLRNLGLKDCTVVRVLESFPSVICLSETEIRKQIEVLRESGIGKDGIDRIVFLFPEFLTIRTESRLIPLLEEFKTLGFSRERIAKEINKDPHVLSLEPGELSRCLKLVKTLKCREGIKSQIYSDGEFRAGYEVKRRVDCLCKHGLIRREAFKILWKEPRVIIYSISDIEKKIDYLIKTMQYSIACLVDVPEYLGVNFEKQIVPRYNVILHLLSKNALADHVELSNIIKLSRHRFYNYYVKPYPECEKFYAKFYASSDTKMGYPSGLWKLLKPERPPHSESDLQNLKSFMEGLI